MRLWSGAVCTGIALTLSSLPATARSSADCAGARQVRTNWAAALQQKDLGAVARIYAGNATFTEPSGTVHIGRPAIVDLFRQVTSRFDSRIALTPVTSRCSGATAAEQGTYAETMTNRETHQAQDLAGTYAMKLKRDEAGTWQILSQAWTLRPK